MSIRNPRFWLSLHLLLVAVPFVSGSARVVLLSVWGVGHIVIWASIFLPRWSLFGPLLWRGEDRPRVALTFDDGPHPEDTPEILRILEELEVTGATFFFVGERVRQYPDLVRRVHEAGHEVEAHSDSHPWWFSLAGTGRLRHELLAVVESIEKVTGRRPKYFRPPMGHEHLFLHEAAREQELTIVTWSTASWDTLSQTAKAIADRVVRHAFPGAIVLLHEGLRRKRGKASLSVSALPQIIAGLRERGLEPGGLGDLLAPQA